MAGYNPDMGKLRGIFYSGLAIFRWSATYRNGRLAILAVSLLLIPQFMGRSTDSAFDSLASQSVPIPPSGLSLLRIPVYALQIMPFVCVICYAAACMLFVFSGWRASRDYRLRRAVTRPVPTPDTTCEFD
jgi:hypothetical protein